MGLSKLYPTHPQNILRKSSFLWKIWLFSFISGQWTKIFRPFAEKLSAGLSKQFTTCPSNNLDENRVFLKTKSLMNLFFEKKSFNLFRTFSGKSSNFWQNNLGLSFQNCILRVNEKIQIKIIFWRNFHRFRTLKETFSSFCSKFFRRGCQNCNLSVDRDFAEKYFFGKEENFFPSSPDNERKNCRFLAKKFRLGCQNSILHVHRNIVLSFFWKKFLVFFHLSWTLSENFATLCEKNFGTHVKTPFFVYVGIISSSEFFPKNTVFHPFKTVSKSVSAFYWKNFGRVVKTVFSRFHRNISKQYFTEKKFSYCFRYSAIKLWPSVQNFSSDLSKPHPTCSQESFEEVFSKILNQFRTLRDKFPALHPKILAEVVKTIPLIHRNILTKNSFF